jgi:predicted metal-dependent hydrolase
MTKIRPRASHPAAPLQLSFSFEAPALSAATPAVELPVRTPSSDLTERARIAMERALSRALGTRVDLELTQNRRTMISTRRQRDGIRVRLHHMFLEADSRVIDALVRYVGRGDRTALRQLGDFIEARRGRFLRVRPHATLRTAGRYHDLAAIFRDLERRFFPGALEGVAITWGRNAGQRGRRKQSIRLGTYTDEEKLIRVHPVLDQPWVPRFFVEYIVFHEMLHHVEPARKERGRTVFHTAEFRRRERAYPDFLRAIAWEKANLDKLLAS